MDEIEIGDMVDHPRSRFMEVLDIEGEMALCSYWETTLSNDGRTQNLVRKQAMFALQELTVVRKGGL